MEKGTKITLCGQHIWCPVIEYNGKKVLISDDDGNQVKIQPESWNLLVEKIQKGDLGAISQ